MLFELFDIHDWKGLKTRIVLFYHLKTLENHDYFVKKNFKKKLLCYDKLIDDLSKVRLRSRTSVDLIKTTGYNRNFLNRIWIYLNFRTVRFLIPLFFKIFFFRLRESDSNFIQVSLSLCIFFFLNFKFAFFFLNFPWNCWKFIFFCDFSGIFFNFRRFWFPYFVSTVRVGYNSSLVITHERGKRGLKTRYIHLWIN